MLVKQQTVPAMVVAFFHTMTVAIVMFVITKVGSVSIWHSFWIGETIALAASAGVYYLKVLKTRALHLPQA